MKSKQKGDMYGKKRWSFDKRSEGDKKKEV